MKIQKTGTTITFSINSSVIGTITDTTPLSRGIVGIYSQSNQGLTTGGHIENMGAYGSAVPATALTLSGPISGYTGPSTNFTVSANGILSSNVGVTLSSGVAGGTFSPSSITLTPGSPSATFTYTPASAGTATLSVTNNASLSNPTPINYVTTLSPSITTLPDARVTAPGWLALSDRIRTQHSGNYFKFNVVGTANLKLGVDTASLVTPMTMRAVVDDVNQPIVAVSAGSSEVTLATGMTTGAHAIRVEITTMDNNGQRWTDLSNTLQVKTILLDAGASLSAASVSPYKIIWNTDSMGEYDDPTNNDANTTYPSLISNALGFEHEHLSFSGIGFANSYSVNPVFYNPSVTVSFQPINGYDSTHSKLVNGKIQADMEVIALGTNDGGVNSATLTQRVTDTITYLRTIFDGPIVYMHPVSARGQYAALHAGVVNYKTANPSDTKVYEVDLGATNETNIQTNYTISGDSVHITKAGQALAASYVLPQFQQIVAAQFPLTISTVSVTPGTTSATVAWSTNQNASSLVKFGLISGVNASTTESDTSSRVTNHSVVVSNLLACTTYHFKAYSQSAASSTALSNDSTFTTLCSGSSSVTASTTSTVTVSSGGTVSLTGTTGTAVSLVAPTNFTSSSSTVLFQVKELTPTSFYSSVTPPSGVSSLGSVYELTAYMGASSTISTFNQPLTLTISYDPAQLGSIVESSLIIYRYDSTTGWTALDNCAVNTGAHTVTCQTTHFSDFALFGNTPTTTTSVTTTTGTSSSGSGSGYIAGYGPNTSSVTAQPAGVCVGGAVYNILTGALCSSTSVTTPSTWNFTQNLQVGSVSSQVKLLQQYLNAKGYTISLNGAGSVGNETTLFGALTKAALIKYQKASGITPASGYFGPLTRVYVSTH